MLDWTRAELKAAVVVYQEMLKLERRGESFVKKRYYESLSLKFDRSEKAFEYRMQNISHVFELLGRRCVNGLKPARNVGANVLTTIKELIDEVEGSQSTQDFEFEEEVARLLENPNLTRPTGVKRPKKKIKAGTVYERRADVVAWVLQDSKGLCESCGEDAPFLKVDGSFYLEVHHLLRLADGGTDQITNAVAVCPNCHRELHYGRDRDKLFDDLYARIPRLNRE
jgi:5-methylcytosine-specific restriction enzyme A